MRIAIDARELRGQPTGVGRVLAGILDAWNRQPEPRAHEFVLCAPAPGDARYSGPNVTWQTRGGSAGTLWEQLTLPRLVRAARADVLFAPAYTGPIRCPVPMVAAIYDVSFVAHPEWFGWREGMRRRLLTGLTAHRAARVLTTSEFSKGEIHRRLGVRVDRINVVYPGTTALADGPAEGHGEQLVLFVGSLFTRRHVPELIQAFAGLAGARDNLRLEIVGDNRTTPRVDFDRLVASTGVADRMTLRSYVPDDLLATLYRRACAFVFLSEYEGFGLTPLEALGAGVPILVLDTPIAREVYGEAALYVPSADPAIVRSALERVLSDAELRARLRDAAGPVLARYSWDTCARQVLNVLLSAAR